MLSFITTLLVLFCVLSPVWLVINAGLFFVWKKRIILLSINTVVAIMMLTLVWGTYVERFRIVTTEQTVQVGFKGKIAVISDTHLGNYLGVWKDKNFLQKVVDRINAQQDIDAVVVAGDWTYILDTTTMRDLFSPLKSSKYPVYGVLGNHDVEHPGQKLRDELKDALEYNRVTLLNNEVVKLEKFNIVGLGELYNGEDDVSLLQKSDLDLNRSVVLTHQPDVTAKYLPKYSPKLTVTGHTHCGQVRTFGLYKYVTPVENKDFDKGLYQLPENRGQLWISCGLGEVGLPLRLENPPSIDILTLY
jgi:uncharacterized protein